MPLDVQNALHARIKALLLGYAPLMALVKAGNVITADDVRSTERDSAKTGPGDFPKIILASTGRAMADREYRNFEDDPAQVDRVIESRVTFEIKVVYDVTPLTGQSPIEAAIDAALLRYGRKMGVQWVASLTSDDVTRRTEMSPDTGGTSRTIARYRITIIARPMRSLLIAS